MYYRIAGRPGKRPLYVREKRFMKQEVTTNKRSANRVWLISAGLVLALAVVLTAANRDWVRGRLAAMKLLPQPERFTELYFPQNLLLPKTADGNPLTFSFTIHNEQGAATTYPYQVVIQLPDGKTQTVASGSTVLADGQMRMLAQSVLLPRGVTTAEIAVVLPAQQESIHFWVGAKS